MWTGHVIGVDRNKRLLEAAKGTTAEVGLDRVVSFKHGDAYSLPFGEGRFDRMVCQTTLWNLAEPLKAIREMKRVCKKGGLVGAVEGAFDHVA